MIIDASEIKIQVPKRLRQRILTYSQYKGGHTFKFLIGIAPNGLIIYISPCYGGRTTDSNLTTDCGILDLLEPGDMVMADKVYSNIT